MLSLTTVFVAVTVVTAASAQSPPVQTRQPHDLFMCDMKAGDRLLMKTQVKQRGIFLNYVDVDLLYPPMQGYEFNEIIHCIKVKDMVSDNNGGYATVTSGGLNQNAVTINLHSQLSKGVDFVVEIHGQDPSAGGAATSPPEY